MVFWLFVLLAFALFVWIGKSVPNKGNLQRADDDHTQVSMPTMGSINGLLGSDETIVSLQSVDTTRGNDGTTYIVDAMIYDRARERQRLERITARSTRNGIVLTDRTPVVPLPSKSDASITFAPMLSRTARDMAYPLEKPGTFELAAFSQPSPETWDFSALDNIESPPMTELVNSLATDESSFKLQYG